MNIIEEYNGHEKSLISEDINGEFYFTLNGFDKSRPSRLKSKPFQLTINSQGGSDESYININLEEMIGMRDLLNEAIESLAPLKVNP